MGGFSNPFAVRQSQFGGDEAGRALRDVLASLAASYGDDEKPLPTTQDILDEAEKMEMIDVILPFAKD